MIGDWGVHMLGPANWGLQLSAPTSVQCIRATGINPVTFPSYVCKYEFPARPNRYVPSGQMAPLTLYWYEGEMARTFEPPEGLTDKDLKGFNTLYVGNKKLMATGGRGETVRLVPESSMQGFRKPPQVLARVKGGHHANWIEACKGGEPANSHFGVAGPYVEWLLLGTIACRFPGEELLWDSKNLRFTNNDMANAFIKPTFRKGWELPNG